MADVELLQAEVEALRAEVERLRAEVAEAREFRDKLAKAIGNDQLRRFIEKHGEPVPLTIRMQAAEARAERLEAEVERLTCELMDATTRAERLAEALEDIRSRSSINLATRSDPFALTAMLGDIHQIAGAALAKENKA